MNENWTPPKGPFVIRVLPPFRNPPETMFVARDYVSFDAPAIKPDYPAEPLRAAGYVPVQRVFLNGMQDGEPVVMSVSPKTLARIEEGLRRYNSPHWCVRAWYRFTNFLQRCWRRIRGTT